MAESLLETDKSSVVEIRPISHSQDHLLPGNCKKAESTVSISLISAHLRLSKFYVSKNDLFLKKKDVAFEIANKLLY